jgi:arsenite transporter
MTTGALLLRDGWSCSHFNIPLQMAASLAARRSDPRASPALGVVAGNRNVALFLSVLPAQTADELLLFIGCFQVPMYVTPFVLARWYRWTARP